MNSDVAMLQSFADTSGFQLRKVYEGMSDATWSAKLNDQGMSAADMAAHFCECYVACGKELRGEKHDWGTYQPPTTDRAGLLAEMFRLRQEAVDGALAGEVSESASKVRDYIVLHDAYHVGQLSLLRVTHEPDWDSYSIYEH